MTSAAVNQSCQVAAEVAAAAVKLELKLELGSHRGNPHMNLPAAGVHCQLQSSEFKVASCQFPVPFRVAPKEMQLGRLITCEGASERAWPKFCHSSTIFTESA